MRVKKRLSFYAHEVVVSFNDIKYAQISIDKLLAIAAKLRKSRSPEIILQAEWLLDVIGKIEDGIVNAKKRGAA